MEASKLVVAVYMALIVQLWCVRRGDIACYPVFELGDHGPQKPEMPTATIIPCYPGYKSVF
jgi:hypothetical protein